MVYLLMLLNKHCERPGITYETRYYIVFSLFIKFCQDQDNFFLLILIVLMENILLKGYHINN